MYGIKVSKPGFDVKTTGNTNLILSSQIDSLPIAIQGEVARTQTSGVHTFNITHDLGFIPFFMTFYRNSRNGKWINLMSQGNGPNLHLNHSGTSSWATDNDNNLVDGPIVSTTTEIECSIEFMNSVSETVTIRHIVFNRGFI